LVNNNYYFVKNNTVQKAILKFRIQDGVFLKADFVRDLLIFGIYLAVKAISKLCYQDLKFL